VCRAPPTLAEARFGYNFDNFVSSANSALVLASPRFPNWVLLPLRLAVRVNCHSTMLALAALAPTALSMGPQIPRHGAYDAATVESNGLSKGPGGFHVVAFHDLDHPDQGIGGEDPPQRKGAARPTSGSAESRSASARRERRGAFDACQGDFQGCVVDSSTGAYVPQFSGIQSSHHLIVDSE
jgi:hypothetical protein